MNSIDILEEMIKPIATRTFIFPDGRKEEKEIYNLERKQIEAIKTLIAENKEVKEEIEELKENNGYHLGFIDGGIAKRYEYEDKIKAKIEELDIKIQCCTYADDDVEEYKQDIEKEKARLLRDKKTLQSLLGKE